MHRNKSFAVKSTPSLMRPIRTILQNVCVKLAGGELGMTGIAESQMMEINQPGVSRTAMMYIYVYYW